MTTNIALWLIAVLLVPVAGSAIRCYFWLDELVKMHRHPETTGFGTIGFLPAIDALTQVSRDQTGAIRDLNALLVWYAEKQGFGKPPPLVHLPRGQGN